MTKKLTLPWETMDENDIHLEAVRRLHEELRGIGIDEPIIVWADERNAYLDGRNPDAYALLMDHFHLDDPEDTSPVDVRLFEMYERHFENIEEQIQKNTMQSIRLETIAPGHTFTDMLTWKEKNGWIGCFEGSHEGLGFESDNHGPYETREKAEEELRDLFEQNDDASPSYSDDDWEEQ